MLVLMHSVWQPYERTHVAGQCVLLRQGKQLEGAKSQQPSLLQTSRIGVLNMQMKITAGE